MLQLQAARLRKGFTVLELLIVIVVIGILATLVLISYNGIQASAREKSVISDADSIDSELARYASKHNGEYGSAVAWYSKGSANANVQFTPSSGNVIDIVANTTQYCIRAYNTATTKYSSLSAAYKKGSTETACTSLSPSSAALADSPIQNTGVVTFLAGSGISGSSDGIGASASFGFHSASKAGLSSDTSGNLYVADYNSGKVRKITSSGEVTSLAPSVYRPEGLVIDSSDNIFVTSSNANIRKITPAGVHTIFVGSPSSNQTGYVDATGTNARFGLNPGTMAIDASDNIYVADSSNQKIRKVTPAGEVTTFASVPGSLSSLTIDGSGNLYLIVSGNALKKVTPAGTVSTVYTDGSASMYAVSADVDGTLYVSTYNQILKITQAGVATAFVGTGIAGTVDGTGTSAQVQSVVSIGKSKSGTMYLIEAANSYRVRKMQ